MQTSQITYRNDIKIKGKELSDLFISSGIKRPVDDLDRLQKMIDNADIIFTAWDNDHLVGVARAITDYSYCCYLSDLAVHKAYQNKGIGKKLVKLIQKDSGEETALLLLSAPGAMDYYPKIDFTPIDNGFKIPRKR